MCLHCRHYYYPHFTDEETEAQRGEATCLVSHAVTEADCNCQKGSQNYFQSHVPFQNGVVPHQEAESISPLSEFGQDLLTASVNRIWGK